MTIEYVFGGSKTEKLEIVQIVLEKNLYVEGWSLKSTLEKILEKSASNFFICMAKEDKPIGVAICLNYGHICFYVQKEFRRQGIGRSMYQVIQKAIDQPYQENLYGEIGIDESKLFFDSLKIPIYS